MTVGPFLVVAALHAALTIACWPTAAIGAPLALSSAPAGSAAATPGGARAEARVSSLAASARSDRSDAALFAAGYDESDWSGSVTGYRIRAGTARLDAAGLWGDLPARARSTANLMDAQDADWPARRLVLSARTSGVATTGIPWEWSALSPAQQAALKTIDGSLDTAPLAEARARDRMAYIRGERSREQAATPAGPLRARASRQGDIVNSKLWFLAGQPAAAHAREDHAAFRAAARSRTPMLYVGGNDAMLHGFDAASGQERIAYLPDGLHPRLERLTHPGYRHGYFVDGSPLSGDLYTGRPGGRDPSGWRTYLAGFLGAGGSGYFVLDVTDPDAFDAAHAASLVVLDRTDGHGMDPDIGHIFSDPVMEAADPSISRQIAHMNDDRWALIMGNGYNSQDEKAVLLIQYLDAGKELVKIVADAQEEAGRGNGLSAPRLIDLDGNGTADLAYAGDLHGNLWKFDLSATRSGGWKAAFGGVPLFVARDATPAAARQPIVAAPVWKAHPQGGLMLAFGTGRELTDADRFDGQVQTVYGIHDDTAIQRSTPAQRASGEAWLAFTVGQGPVRTGRSRLVAQILRSDTARGPGTVSSNPVGYTGSEARRGWFLDLPLARERVLRHPGWFEGDLIDIWSTVPATADGALALGAARSFRTTIDIFSGAAPTSPLLLGVPQVAVGQASRTEAGLGTSIRSGSLDIGLSAPGMPAPPTRHRLGKTTLRPNWRQLQ